MRAITGEGVGTTRLHRPLALPVTEPLVGKGVAPVVRLPRGGVPLERWAVRSGAAVGPHVRQVSRVEWQSILRYPLVRLRAQDQRRRATLDAAKDRQTDRQPGSSSTRGRWLPSDCKALSGPFTPPSVTPPRAIERLAWGWLGLGEPPGVPSGHASEAVRPGVSTGRVSRGVLPRVVQQPSQQRTQLRLVLVLLFVLFAHEFELAWRDIGRCREMYGAAGLGARA